MKTSNFLYEIDNEGIVVLTINRPELRNAMNDECWRELLSIMDQIDRMSEPRAVILTGAGDKAFIAGADLNNMIQKGSVDVLGGGGQKALDMIERCSKPVIAAVNGYAFGGGCEAAIACDIRIVSENARFGLPELSLGILPGCGGTQRLTRLIGLGRTKEMILTGRAIKPDEAVSIGLATKCVPLKSLLDEAKEIARSILKKGPIAVRLAKRIIQASTSVDQESGLLMEMLALSVLCGTEDKKEGVTAFLEKRDASFTSR